MKFHGRQKNTYLKEVVFLIWGNVMVIVFVCNAKSFAIANILSICSTANKLTKVACTIFETC